MCCVEDEMFEEIEGARNTVGSNTLFEHRGVGMNRNSNGHNPDER